MKRRWALWVCVVLLGLTSEEWIRSHLKANSVRYHQWTDPIRYVHIISDSGLWYVTVAADKGWFGGVLKRADTPAFLELDPLGIWMPVQSSLSSLSFGPEGVSPWGRGLMPTSPANVAQWDANGRRRSSPGLPFGFDHRKKAMGRGSGEEWRFFIHFGVLATLLSLYPITMFLVIPIRQFRRRRNGLCMSCAYNLTGNTSGTCSECGERIG